MIDVSVCHECALYLDVAVRDRLTSLPYNCKRHRCKVAAGARACSAAKPRRTAPPDHEQGRLL